MKILTFIFVTVLSLFLLLLTLMNLPEKTDVLIIGAGASGMRAALESCRYTDHIILLEKMPYPGGNSNRATAGLNSALSHSDLSPYQNDTMEAGRHKGDEALIRMMVEQSTEALVWLKEQGADLSDKGLLAGHSVSRTFRPAGGAPVGREISSVLYSAMNKQGIDLRTENKALSITQKKKSLFVLVENRTGREYTIKARSVIIATGGFGGNPEMVVRYNPALKGFNTTNSPAASGDFLKLTENLPVQLIGLEDIQTHPTVEPDFGILITEALRGNGGILVNTQGRRFTDEMAFREVLSQKILDQKGGYSWLIFDQTIRESLKSSEYYFEKKLVREAGSLSSLAEELSIPGSLLKDSLKVWNQSVLKGQDEQFLRKDLRVPLVNAPFYAIKVTPGVHYCMGGLAINGHAQVLDLKDLPVPGLFAAGEATGGIHGKDRLGGNSLTDALVFGEIAGREASLYALKKGTARDKSVSP